MTTPIHRNEHTGNVGLDRIQGNVRDLLVQVQALQKRVAEHERVHGVGVARVVMGNANYKLSPEEAAKAVIIVAGAHTAVRTLTLPPVHEPGSYYVRVIRNTATGGFSINLTTGVGVVSLSSGVAVTVVVTSTGLIFP